METSNYPPVTTTTAERATPSQPQVPVDGNQKGVELNPVESWEELADDSARPHPSSIEGGEEMTPAGTREPSAGTTEDPKDVEDTESKEAVLKDSDDVKAMDEVDIEVTTKDTTEQSTVEKKPSPPTDRISKAAAKAAPPVKSKEDKEILNIVFIGHVGK